VAVLREWRGSGAGRRVMRALEQAAQAHGLRRLRLNAQASAEGFYRQLGYRPCGAPFDEVGIAHIPMQKTLD
jgi:predicted GNAT family N-acyltransferase